MKYAGVVALIVLFAAAGISPATAQYRTESAVDLLLNRVFGDHDRMSRLPTVIRDEGVDADRRDRVDDRREGVDDRERTATTHRAGTRSGRSETGAHTDRADRTQTADRNDRDDRSAEPRRTERRERARTSGRGQTDRADGRNPRDGRIVIGRRDGDGDYERRRDRDRRYEKRNGKANHGKGPAFCRSGAGHPVHGRQWCRDKGFGLGDDRQIYDDRRIYDQRRDGRRDDSRRDDRRRRSNDSTILDDILGRLND